MTTTARRSRSTTAPARRLTNSQAQAFALLSDIRERLSREGLGRQGKMYDGERDIAKVGGYPENPGVRDFRRMYDRDPIAGRAVDMIAETTWRKPPAVTGKGAGWDKAWEDLQSRLKLWSRCERADKLARLGRYSVILIGTKGTDDRALAQPIETRARRGSDILYVSVFDEGRAPIKKWETDPTSDRYGMPLTYEIDVAGDTMTGASATVKKTMVHASRLIHVAADCLDDDTFGRPSLRRIFNDLLDLQKISTSSAEAFWQRVAGVLQAIIDKDVTGLGTKELGELDDQMLAIVHDLRRYFVGKGVKLERLGDTEPNPDAASVLAMRRIAAGSEYPMRMLFGSETGERASTEDQRAYLGTVRERQTTFAEPAILRPLLDYFIKLGALPGRVSGAPGTTATKAPYEIAWPDLMEESPSDQAAANLSRAQTASALTPVGGDPLLLVEIDEDSNVWLVPREAGADSPFDVPDPDDGQESDDSELDDGAESVEDGAESTDDTAGAQP